VVKGDEIVDGLGHEGMTFCGKHKVIGNPDGNGFGENDIKFEEGVQGAKTFDIKVEIDAAVVVEHKVTDGIGPLDGVDIRVKSGKEPRVFLCNKFTRRRVCPEHVLVAGVLGQTRLPHRLPAVGEYSSLPGLMNDPRDLLARRVCWHTLRLIGDLEFGDICSRVDGEVVGDGAKDEDGAQEEETEDR
jgi:hypothetical protein